MRGGYEHCLPTCEEFYGPYGKHEPSCRRDEIAALKAEVAGLHELLGEIARDEVCCGDCWVAGKRPYWWEEHFDH